MRNLISGENCKQFVTPALDAVLQYGGVYCKRDKAN